MSTVTIQIGPHKKSVPFTGELSLSSITAPYGLPMPCGGHHTCGKCKVKAFGSLSPLTSEEERLLTPQEIADGVRMACSAVATGDCTVILSQRDPVNSAGCGGHAHMDARAFQRGTGCGRTGVELTVMVQAHFAVGADVGQ